MARRRRTFEKEPMTPQTTSYPFSASLLALFAANYLTRAAAQAAGLYVPPFNAAAPIKGWIDPSGAGGFYDVLAPLSPQTGFVTQIYVSPAQAAVLNLPGVEIYPVYTAAPVLASQAYMGQVIAMGVDISGIAMLPSLAADLAAALESAFASQGTITTMDNTQLSGWTIEPPSAARVIYLILTGPAGNRVCGWNAQDLYASSQRTGAGAPGTWSVGSYNVPTWTPTPQASTAPAGAVTLPAPIRALLPGEAI